MNHNEIFMFIYTYVSQYICMFVRTDQTGKLSKHIYAPELGPKLPSQVILDQTEAYLAKWSNPFPQNRKGWSPQPCGRAWLSLAGVPPCGLPSVPRLDVAPQHRPLGGFAVAHRPLGGFAMGRVRTGDLYSLVGTDKTNDFNHFAKQDSVRSESTQVGNFGPWSGV